MVTSISSPTSKVSARESPRGSAVSMPMASSRSRVPLVQRATRYRELQPAHRALALLRGRQALFLRLGDVHALQEQGEAGRRQRAAEAAHQLVVAPASAEHVADARGRRPRRSRPSSSRGRAARPEVEPDAIGDTALAELLEGRCEPALARLTASPPSSGASRTSAPPRMFGSRSNVSRAPARRARGRRPRPRARRGRARRGGEDGRAALALHAQLVEELLEEVGVAEADHGPGEAGGVERGAQHLDHLHRPGRGVARRSARRRPA